MLKKALISILCAALPGIGTFVSTALYFRDKQNKRFFALLAALSAISTVVPVMRFAIFGIAIMEVISGGSVLHHKKPIPQKVQ